MGIADIFARRKGEPPYRLLDFDGNLACGKCGATPLVGTWGDTGIEVGVLSSDIGGVGVCPHPAGSAFPEEVATALDSGQGLAAVDCVGCGHRLLTPHG